VNYFIRKQGDRLRTLLLINFAGYGDDPVVVLHYFFNDGKPDACAGVLLFAVKSLKYFKDAVFILRVEANAII